MPPFHNEDMCAICPVEVKIDKLDLLLRGDGSEDHPGIVILLDRLNQSSKTREKEQERHQKWLYSLTGGLALALSHRYLSSLFGLAW